MPAPPPRVFTIPPSAPFLPTLVRALVDGKLIPGFPDPQDPLSLAGASIYLPTRRACRLAQTMFLDALGAEAAMLPRLVPLGEIDEDELAFTEAAAGVPLDLPTAIAPLERRLLLARMILQWARSPGVQKAGATPLVATTPAAALALADALARLIDDMITREVPWERLDRLVPGEVDAYWQITLGFLQIARHAWPKLLADNGLIEAAALRDRLIALERARLAANASGPVIAAGSTASMPATAQLLATIARLPQGAVVLPGLDRHLDAAAWNLIAAEANDGESAVPAVTHPQFAMHAFLAQLGLGRDAVVPLGPSGARERLVSEALRPAGATERWSSRPAPETLAAALHGVSLIEAASPEEEALAIAVALRETLETAGATAALITPDRGLARRVTAALARWHIEALDSAGEPLAATAAGVFARLVAEAVLGGLQPVPLLALLRHPLLRLDADGGAQRRAVGTLERALLRGPRPLPGCAGLARALAAFRETQPTLHRRDPRRALGAAALDEAARLLARLTAAVAPLEQNGDRATTLALLAERHQQAMAALAGGSEALRTAAGSGADLLLEAFAAITGSPAARALELRPTDYLETFVGLIADEVQAPAPMAAARIRIFGPLEARLQSVDRVVLGGLAEGTWPPQTRSDPWLSRPMRRALGLDLPERRIGLSAHDFAQALGAREVVLSRAAKVAGAPTVPSRFLQRLAALAGEHWETARAAGRRYVAYAHCLDHADAPQPVARPEPRPPLAARPLRLTITEIEDWTRDPYTIYARHVLRLPPLEPIDASPGARDRGTAIHAAIEEFGTRYATALPDDPAGELLAIGRRHFQPLEAFPEAKAFWWPRFERIAAWLAEWELARRDDIVAIHSEVSGRLEIPLGERTFVLAGRADRIEARRDGSYVLLDFKTGQAPSTKQVLTGLSPQLTLGAALLRQGGFDGIPSGATLSAMSYVQVGGGDPAGRDCAIDFKGTTADAEADKALAQLRGLVQGFEDEGQPYRSLTQPTSRQRYGDYDHLARVKEWSVLRDDAGPA